MASASSLAETIEKDFLACAICFEQLTDPVGLPCLHAFCFECLDNWHKTNKNKTKVACPACKETALVPTDGIKGFPRHFLIKNLTETINMEKKKPSSELAVGNKVRVKPTIAQPSKLWGKVTHKSVGAIERITGTSCTVNFPEQQNWACELNELELVKKQITRQITCDICGTQDPAYHCLDCKDNICSSCITSHKTFRYMKDHKIVTVKDLESGKVTQEGRFCKIHGERVRYYCETEHKQVCPDCVGLKTCAVDHDRISMTDAAKKQASQLDELITKCKAVNSQIEDAIKETKKVQQDLNKAKEETTAVVEKAQKECHDKIDAIAEEQKEKITKLVETRGKKIQDTLSEMEKKSTEIQKSCEKGAELTHPGNEFEITYAFASISKSLQELSEMQSKILPPDKSLSKLKFEASIPTIASIGQVLESE